VLDYFLSIALSMEAGVLPCIWLYSDRIDEPMTIAAVATGVILGLVGSVTMIHEAGTDYEKVRNLKAEIENITATPEYKTIEDSMKGEGTENVNR
jgi:hypothetical protein